jgi:hypothetical protein
LFDDLIVGGTRELNVNAPGRDCEDWRSWLRGKRALDMLLTSNKLRLAAVGIAALAQSEVAGEKD